MLTVLWNPTAMYFSSTQLHFIISCCWPFSQFCTRWFIHSLKCDFI